jgi:hypothetical protein
MTANKAFYRRLWLQCINNIKKDPERAQYWMGQAKEAKAKWAEARRKEQQDAVH